MLSVLRVHLPSDIPIAGCELSPYVLLRRPDLSVTTDDIPEQAPVDGFYLRCRWHEGVLGSPSYLCTALGTDEVDSASVEAYYDRVSASFSA